MNFVAEGTQAPPTTDAPGDPRGGTARASGGEGRIAELSSVARLMRRYRLDSVEMPSGLKVLKTTHQPFAEAPPSPEAVDEAATRRLEALGLVNATEASGRVPLEDDEVMFAASRAPEVSLEDFRPAPAPGEERTDAPDDE